MVVDQWMIGIHHAFDRESVFSGRQRAGHDRAGILGIKTPYTNGSAANGAMGNHPFRANPERTQLKKVTSRARYQRGGIILCGHGGAG